MMRCRPPAIWWLCCQISAVNSPSPCVHWCTCCISSRTSARWFTSVSAVVHLHWRLGGWFRPW